MFHPVPGSRALPSTFNAVDGARLRVGQDAARVGVLPCKRQRRSLAEVQS
jgi:hypothetical protein